MSYIHCCLYPGSGQIAPACSTVLNWVRSFMSGKETAQWLSANGIAVPLRNGSVKPSGSSQGDGIDVKRRRGIC